MAQHRAPFSQRERWALCDLLEKLGPDVPTLCEGWRSIDLAAHLALRDRRPDATPGMTMSRGPLAKWTERAQRGLRDRMTWEDLVDRVRRGPALPLRPVDPLVNSVEYFVHHEDLRRAQEEWEPRSLEPEDEALLWRQLRFLAKPLAHAGITRVQSPGLTPIVLRGKGRSVLEGPVGELVLWANRRKSVAQVELSEAV